MGLITLAALRTLVMFSPQLYWMIDPRAVNVDIPTVEFGPTGAAITDWLCVVVLLLAIVDRLLRGGRVRWILLTLWLTGAGFVLFHGHDDAESLRLGGDWLGAMALGLAGLHLGVDVNWRRLILAAAVGLIVPLAGQAIYQVTVEHAMTVQNYEEHKAEIIRERGWTEGSTEQVKYEERLHQLEATARFGFSNIFGTVMATLSLIALGAAVTLLLSEPRKAEGYVIAAAAMMGLITLGLTFSKGALLAMIIAVVATGMVCAVSHVLKLGAAWWRIAAVVVVAMGLGAVAVRGAMGPPETAAGERSLLFRWHYWQAAERMLEQDPITGIGPGRFQQHYLTTKNPLNPEEVSDPHNVFVAYLSTLGIGGAAWVMVLIAMLCGAAGCVKRLETDEMKVDAPPLNEPWLWGAAIAAGVLACGTQYIAEWHRYWIETSALWVAASVLFVIITGMLARRDTLDGPYARLGLFAAAITLLLHSQIEMTLTNTMAAPLMFATLGAIVAAPSIKPHPRWQLFTMIPVGLAVLVTLMILHVIPVATQQSTLAAAADRLQRGDGRTAIALLEQANADGPFDARIAQDRARLLAEAGRPDQAVDVLAAARDHGQLLAQLWRTEAAIAANVWQQHRRADWLKRAVYAAEHATLYDPFGINTHVIAGDLAYQAGRIDQARALYRKALQLSDQAYLDPNKQLPVDERARLTGRLGG
ncbi:O-antigen ligase family protein [Planctomycetales bacterium ZRK34]|nr:O-antigen ligase family protein [Planctomycetales bacterium ZRK34]